MIIMTKKPTPFYPDRARLCVKKMLGYDLTHPQFASTI